MQLAKTAADAEDQAKRMLSKKYQNVDFRDYDIDTEFIEKRNENNCYEVFFRDSDYVSLPLIACGNDIDDVKQTIKCNYILEHSEFAITESELTVEELPYF
jgi:hypothetical protein